MTLTEEIALMHYVQAVELPRFKARLNRLLNEDAYDAILTTHSIEASDLCQLIEKAVSEGNAVLIQRELNGFMVVLWKD